MKWYNKDKTRMVDVSAIDSYDYRQVCRRLSIVINGYEHKFEGDDADEIYTILQSQKEVL